ncbi:MAG: molybdopterin biosynthesis protein [Chloroflexi bacterium]|nr:molybdopterin biosynthesis protein [Chloroflexota bacterium]
MNKRKIYLEDIPLEEAWSRLIGALEAANQWRPFPGETVPVGEALGRVTAEPVWAKLSAPHYHASAMDGWAVRAQSTNAATDTAPLQLAVPDQAQYVDTGDPLPAWADAVIPIENVQVFEKSPDTQSQIQNPKSKIEIRASVAPWSHIRAMGEDMVATELVLPSNHTLRPVDLGAIAGCGHTHVNVRRKPRVAVIPTGAELVPAGAEVKPGDIIEYNSLVLAAQVKTWGGLATRWPIIPDDFDKICAAAREAAQTHDLVLLNAGSSAGSEDFSALVVETLGALLVHGVAVRPGHPVILGMIDQAKTENPKSQNPKIPIIGVPGYPVSAAITGEIFVEPILSRWLGRAPAQPIQMPATLSRKIASPMGDDEYMRVTVGKVGDRIVATPLARGAGVITSLVRADGIVRIPRFSEGLQAGEQVTVHLYRAPAQIENTIVAIGSHDLCLDLLGQFLAERAPGMRLASANVGSLGGLIALRRGEAHLAGTHLLDPETGEYNLTYVKRYLPDMPVALVTLVGREQGLLAQRGNPKNIHTLADLARDDITFVNRQRGAGTRVLLDFEIEKIGLKAESIRGYEREEYTHLAVGAAVSSGVADCGLGIHSAATALELDFIPLFKERYDLAIPGAFFESSLLKPLLDVLQDGAFREAVSRLPGYDVRNMGTVVAEVL